MDLRRHYAESANHAAFTYSHYIEQLEMNTRISDAMDEVPVEISKGRRLSDIVLDDMMERFSTIMAVTNNDRAIPFGFYHYLFTKRYGDDIGTTDQEVEAHMHHEIRQQRYKDAPEALPTFLKILEPHLTANELASLTNQWNDIFNSVVRLTAPDDSLRIHDRNISTQNAMVQVANNAILLKNTGGTGKVNGGRKNSSGVNGSEDGDDDENELDVLAKRLAEADLPEKARETVDKIIRRTAKMAEHMNERHTNIKRLELIADLPWNKNTETTKDLQSAADILDEDHYGLEKVKERILRHVAVQMHTGQTKGKIICLAGPPGVGKTSIAQSVAKALGRNYGRVSLGGVNDESKIRGHSSTYVGALPGIILQGMKEAKSSNPLIVLDEIDKMGQDARRGDPTAAMLEVLDPAQNFSFRDDFAGIEYDISNTFFFATANDLSTIPGPLRDRMQIIQLPGYQPEEKFEIATRYLLPKQMKQNGLSAETFSVDDEAIKTLISSYTREAGVRSLEGKLNEICTSAVMKIVKGHKDPIRVTKDDLKEYVGIAYGGQDTIADEDQIGVVNGLSYSSVGGGVLPIEVNLSPSTAGFRITVTGNLGKVMSESTAVAESLIHARAPQFGIADATLNKARLHVHAPDGAVPKDGPSAGAAFTTALVSSLTGIPVRRDIAMTGEINARGQVTAIGGLPEKLQGAQAAGVKTVLIPKENVPHLEEVAQNVLDKLEVIPVSTIEEVLKHALTEELKPVAAPAPAARSWTTRLRDAWSVMKQASNDNTPQAVRQPAGPRRQTPGDYTP